MLQDVQLEALLTAAARLDRATLGRRLLGFPWRIPVDLTPAFVAATDLDRLRHVYLAVCLQTGQIPGPEDDVRLSESGVTLLAA